MSGTLEVRVLDNVTPLDDLNVAIEILYKTSKDEDRPVKKYKPNPGYIAGAPSYLLSTDPSNTTIHIGQVVEVTLKIIVKRMTLYGNINVCTFIQQVLSISDGLGP